MKKDIQVYANPVDKPAEQVILDLCSPVSETKRRPTSAPGWAQEGLLPLTSGFYFCDSW
jgi:hypothetical protein